MDLRQWNTNVDKLGETLTTKVTLATTKPNFLGLEWNPEEDAISFTVEKIESETKDHNQFTKRGASSIVGKLFDPLGLFLETFIVRAKVMLLEL